MRARRRKIDPVTIAYANDRHKDAIRFWRRRLDGVDKDPDKAKRLASAECPICFYERSRIGGAACTQAQCAFCDKKLSSGNTCIDVMCTECAVKTGLCKHCGADVNLRSRRNIVLPERTEDLPER